MWFRQAHRFLQTLFLFLFDKLIQYFEINLIPAAEDIYCPKMNIFDEETVDNFYELQTLLKSSFST